MAVHMTRMTVMLAAAVLVLVLVLVTVRGHEG
jgi:preprotein translocase subunit SecG